MEKQPALTLQHERLSMRKTFVLALPCPNRPGIVAAVASRLFGANANILDAQQFDDTKADTFFMRVVFADWRIARKSGLSSADNVALP
jgi:formyltetrahydrofolate hydrolase